MQDSFSRSAEHDPRIGIRFLSPMLYPSKRDVYRDWLRTLEIRRADNGDGLVATNTDGAEFEIAAPHESTFYRVRNLDRAIVETEHHHTSLISF